MRRSRIAMTLAVGCAWSLAWLAAGCGPGAQPVTEKPEQGVALSEVGEAYRVFTINNNRPPAKAEDFAAIEMMCPTGVVAVKKGDVVVRWGATLPDTGEEPGKVAAPEILAYLKRVPEEGGYVLFRDRTIRKLTADEFKAAPQAGPAAK